MFRRQKYEVDINDIVSFCEVFRNIGENDQHQVIGGELTMMPVGKLDEIISVLNSYKRRITIMTNGYNLLGLERSTINKIDRVILNNHNINSDLIDECVEYLNSFCIDFEVLNMRFHYDLEKAQTAKRNKGVRCENWLSTLALHNRVIYPCCVQYAAMIVNNTDEMKTELIKSGWTLDNKRIIEALADSEESLSEYIIDQCENNCWNPDFSVAPKALITRKGNDVIRKN
jgi:hypothetical protein